SAPPTTSSPSASAASGAAGPTATPSCGAPRPPPCRRWRCPTSEGDRGIRSPDYHSRMINVVAAGRRLLPRGYTDFGRQVVIWVGFYVSYLAVRGIVDRNPTKAILNGFRVIDFEQRMTHHLVERTTQRIADSSHLLL